MANYIIEKLSNGNYASTYYRTPLFSDMFKILKYATNVVWYRDYGWRIKLGNKILFYIAVNGEIILKED
jgi:hypothetical protein